MRHESYLNRGNESFEAQPHMLHSPLLEEVHRDLGAPMFQRHREDVPSASEFSFPERQPNTLTGSEFFTQVLGAGGPHTKGVMGADRERAILHQIELGNVPDFLRHPKKVTVHDRNGNTAELSVMPDYLAIGTNEDFVRVPVTPVLAKAIADKYGLALPTKKVVDDIYHQADVRLTGRGLVYSRGDTAYMQGNGFYLEHNQEIERQLGGHDGELVAGHKKDIIISKYAETHPGRLDFYGLFDRTGKAIQGAHGGPHEKTYVDYSHGARFIGQDVIVDGRHMRYDDVLKNPQLAGLLSDEGTFDPASVYRV